MSDSGLELLKVTDSAGFDAFQCIDQLRLNCLNIGLHYHLVKKLYNYTYDELEFFIPQLIQLLVSFQTESVALEEFLLDYCDKYPHFSLIVFWNLQAYIFELRNDPESYSFQTVRKFINKLQDILFNVESNTSKAPEYRENLQPSLILCGSIAAAIGLPNINGYALPLIKTQGKQQKSFVFKLANFQKALTRNLTIKNQKISKDASKSIASDDENTLTSSFSAPRGKSSDIPQRSLSTSRIPSSKRGPSMSDDSETNSTDDEIETQSESAFARKHRSLDLREASSDYQHEAIKTFEDNLKINTIIKSKKNLRRGDSNIYLDQLTSSSHSMPDLGKVEIKDRPYLSPTESESSLIFPSSAEAPTERKVNRKILLSARATLHEQQLKQLQVNYAKKETEFIMSLQNISLRLSQVPKEARLSALRAELSIINETLLPSEIDIPQLLPITSSKNKKYHKILRLSINEACVLNSAERVPFLLFVEFLSDEIDFNPFSEQNQKILANRNQQGEGPKSEPSSPNLIEVTQSNIRSSEAIDANSGPSYYSPDVSRHETDLGDMATLVKRTSSHDLSRFRILDSIDDFDGVSLGSPNPSTDMSTKVLADQMRIAAVMLQQLENSGQATSEQSTAIKERIVGSMISLQDQFDSINYDKLNQLRGNNPDAGERKLENDFKLGEDWLSKKARIRKSSIYGHFENWDLCSVIAKNGDDLPQEAFACQLISMMSNIWKKDNVPCWTKRMKILITSANTGLVETITNAISIHSIKKSLTEISISHGENSKGRIFTLQDYFVKLFGLSDSSKYRHAQDNFARSLASYSILCYVLQIKDRHNGNIMLDHEGHIIHIDFGFLLSNSPGSVGFEAAPFKLTTEYVDLLGGIDSPLYAKFRDLCKRCFSSLRKNSDQIINIVELMQKESNLPCFKNGENTSVLLRQRLQLQLSDVDSDAFVENYLIGKSIGSVYTRLYDQFQMVTQGIYS